MILILILIIIIIIIIIIIMLVIIIILLLVGTHRFANDVDQHVRSSLVFFTPPPPRVRSRPAPRGRAHPKTIEDDLYSVGIFRTHHPAAAQPVLPDLRKDRKRI
jgi:flagellar basal body-associated protein FliL